MPDKKRAGPVVIVAVHEKIQIRELAQRHVSVRELREDAPLEDERPETVLLEQSQRVG
jgi:hypothetical protein